jgi:hypothetical protein
MKTLRFLLSLRLALFVLTPALWSDALDGVGYWSDVMKIAPLAESGTAAAVSQRYYFTNTAGPLGLPIELVYSPTTSSVWMGYPRQSYFELAGAMWSANAEGHALEFIGPRTVLPDQSVRAFADQWVADYVAGKFIWPSYHEGVVQFSLGQIFGDEALTDANSDMMGTGLSITSIQLTNNTVDVRLRVRNGNEFELAFSPEFQLLSAAQNGKPTATLLDGRVPLRGGSNPWASRKVLLNSTKGAVEANLCARTFLSGEHLDVPGIGRTSQARIPYALGIGVLVLANGDVWVGPSDSRWALLNDDIIGIKLYRPTQELLVFKGWRTRIPTSDGQRIPALQKLLAQVESEVAAGSLPFTQKLKLSDVFAGDAALPNDPDISLRKFYLDGDRLTLVLRHPQANENLFINLTPELQTVSIQRTTGMPPY